MDRADEWAQHEEPRPEPDASGARIPPPRPPTASGLNQPDKGDDIALLRGRVYQWFRTGAPRRFLEEPDASAAFEADVAALERAQQLERNRLEPSQ